MFSLKDMTSSNFAVIALVFLVGLVLGGAVIYLLGRRRGAPSRPVSAQGEKPALDLSFRWGYVLLPAAVALVTIVALAVLYSSLPAEVYYRFSSAGVPRGSIGREGFLAIMVGAQILMVGAATAVASMVLRIARRMLKDSPTFVDPGRAIWLMVNMLVLPQLIVSFVALDSAYYARSGTHIMSPWLFSLVTIGIGTLVIIFLFAQSFNETRKAS